MIYLWLSKTNFVSNFIDEIWKKVLGYETPTEWIQSMEWIRKYVDVDHHLHVDEDAKLWGMKSYLKIRNVKTNSHFVEIFISQL